MIDLEYAPTPSSLQIVIGTLFFWHIGFDNVSLSSIGRVGVCLSETPNMSSYVADEYRAQ